MRLGDSRLTKVLVLKATARPRISELIFGPLTHARSLSLFCMAVSLV